MEDLFFTYYEKPEKYTQINSSSETKKEEKENKNYYTKSHHSSDLTSLSLTPTETFSQTAENSYVPNDLSASKIMSGENSKLNYFSDIINYFKKAEPEKFSEYKNSKNFILKRKKEKNENISYNNNMNTSYNNNVQEKNKAPIYYIQVGNNTSNNILNGNIIYYIYNNFYFNYPVNIIQTKNNINKNDIDQENKENKALEKERENDNKSNSQEIEEKTETKKNDEIEIIKVEKKFENNRDKIDDNYFPKKRNNKNYNDKLIKKENKEIEIEYYEGNKHRFHKDYHIYNGPIDTKTYSHKFKAKYKQNEYFNKFNANFGGRRKNYFDEYRFYKRKYHQKMYY